MDHRLITLRSGEKIPRLGQGTWYMGERKQQAEHESAALKLGIELGLTLIDTAEMYGDGGAETVVGQAVAGYARENLFIVSKVYPHNAGRRNIFHSCDATLARLGTDYLDLYLLHWRGRVPLAETVECMETLVAEGKICHWGVSNFDTDDMTELWQIPRGNHCAVNQVLYHLGSRGTEFDLQPWLVKHQVPMMAYSPLAQAGNLQRRLLTHPAVTSVAAELGISTMQILLAFVLHQPNTIAIPKAASEVHVRENAAVLDIQLTDSQLARLDNAFPPPQRKTALDII